ncbi:MAG: cobalamin biosynthesis protein CbiG [Pseudomonadota bacterium]
MKKLFDRYLIVDWSASNTPKRGKDSIWIALHDGERLVRLENPSTRFEAMATVTAECKACVADGKRLFAGFDFAFGWPVGATQAVTGNPGWVSLWGYLASAIVDDQQNRSNRFEVAARINRDVFGGVGPFWGCPSQQAHKGLTPKKSAFDYADFDERRVVERAIPKAQPVWKLFTTGSVGSQSLLGIAHLQKLREELGDAVAIWPFETQFAGNFLRPVTVAEIYPSLFTVTPEEGEVLDAAQVRTVAERFAELDSVGEFSSLLEGSDDPAVLVEEGWIVGVGIR